MPVQLVDNQTIDNPLECSVSSGHENEPRYYFKIGNFTFYVLYC